MSIRLIIKAETKSYWHHCLAFLTEPNNINTTENIYDLLKKNLWAVQSDSIKFITNVKLYKVEVMLNNIDKKINKKKDGMHLETLKKANSESKH